jgi:hypothetical protein
MFIVDAIRGHFASSIIGRQARAAHPANAAHQLKQPLPRLKGQVCRLKMFDSATRIFSLQPFFVLSFKKYKINENFRFLKHFYLAVFSHFLRKNLLHLMHLMYF